MPIQESQVCVVCRPVWTGWRGPLRVETDIALRSAHLKTTFSGPPSNRSNRQRLLWLWIINDAELEGRPTRIWRNLAERSTLGCPLDQLKPLLLRGR